MTTFNSANATPAAVSELVSATKETNLQEPIVASIDSGPVQAYAKLEGDDFCYYIRTLQVSLGRKVTNPENVDIPLGNTKSVSRQHARLFYNFSSQRFELMVFGKNGAFVNEQFIERGVTVPLDNKTKIQIGEMAFVFLLPKSNTDTVNTTNNASPHHNDNNFGYISTPHQLEKNIKNTSPPTQSQESEDYDMSDDGSESSGPNPYSNKDIKPPYSYASLIAQAINSSKDKRMTLNGIYNYITTNYPYYQMAQNGWQNSIRHNLSLNKAFVKVPRGETEPGKGAFWTIDINAETQFTNGVYKRNKRSGSITHSENVKKKSKKDTTVKAIPDSDNSEEEEDELIDDDEEKLLISAVKEEQNDDETTQSLLVANAIVKETETVPLKEKEIIPVKVTDEKKDVIIEPITTPIVSTVPTAGTISNDPTIQATNTNNNQEAQAQLQLQLQNTIRQHLLDPIRYPLPPSIAQLLPQAIAQLPPQLATQLSSTLQTSIKVTEASAVAIPDTENDAKNTIVESEK